MHKPITKRATKPRTLSEESSEMDHGKQRSELHQSTSAAQHSPLAMFLQVNDLFLLAKVTHESSHCIELPDLTNANGRPKEARLQKTRTEKARSEFTYRNCRLENRLEKYVEFSRPYGPRRD